MAAACALPSPAAADSGDDELNKYVRILHKGAPRYGVLSLGQVRLLDKSFFGDDPKYTGEVVALKEAKLLAPVEPSKVIAVALNYPNPRALKDGEIGLFSKLPSSIIATGEEIVPPPGSKALHYEGEMVLVMGERARNISEAEVADHIFGVTIGNDISERSIGTNLLNIIRGKGSDTFGPLGPWVVRGLNYDDLELTTRLNGKVVQQERTSKMLNSVKRMVSYISRYITLEPGDVIYTGTPGKTQPMKPGDVVEVQLEGAGTLRNTVGRPEP
ncbi:MAG: fumarylacetoacetate hydrolase family protein [Alphaproteobacteria bacterium]|nr:fumarylacetoacetate hydrolase family protein [Alphaproteobacteria bacterium]